MVMKPEISCAGCHNLPYTCHNSYRKEYAHAETYASNIFKVITLRRRGDESLGFSIRGGWEHGTGIFVSYVSNGSLAAKHGLKIGDQIIRINGFSIQQAIHIEVLNLLRTCPGIVLKIKRVGVLPVKEKNEDPITWRVIEPQSSTVSSDQQSYSSESGRIPVVAKVQISVPGSSSLGCSIAKGPLEMPGIFMCTVKGGGIADQADLQVGDQILDMNGTSFDDLKLSEAVALMKSAKEISLTVKKGAGRCLFLDSYYSCFKKDHLTPSCLTNRFFISLNDQSLSDCSSKSEDSSFQSSSSDSEKDYSISEESAFDGLNKGQHKTTLSKPFLEDAWYSKENQNLKDSVKIFGNEMQCTEEKRICEDMTQTESIVSNKSKGTTFLSELQKMAARMNKPSTNNTAVIDGDKNASADKFNKIEGFKGKKCKEDAMKRMQHEMLMEEFREAHRKMFGQQHTGLSIDVQGGGNEIAPSVYDLSSMKNNEKVSTLEQHKKKQEIEKVALNAQIPNDQEQLQIQIVKTRVDGSSSITSSVYSGVKVFMTDQTQAACEKNVSSSLKVKSGNLVEVIPWGTRL